MHINNNYLFKKIQCLLFSIVFFFFAAEHSFAQQDLLHQKINVDFKKVTLRKAFKQIEKQLSCYFTYESSTINNQKRVTVRLVNISLKAGLDSLLNDSSLVYKVVDNHVVIRKGVLVKKEIVTDSVPEYSTIRGKLIDVEDGAALPFATVSLLGYSIGAIANAQGEFIFKVPGRYFNEQVCIAHLGYSNLCLQVQDMLDTNKVYQLNRNFISLQEVIIRKRAAKDLIKAAIENTKKYYRNEPSYLTGFYREAVTRRNNYMFFSEAVVKIYKSSYIQDFEQDMVKVLKARKMENLSEEDSIAVKLKSGLNACLELDIAKNLTDFLKEENFSDYNYNMSDIVSFNGRNVYVIEFKQTEFIKDALFLGKVYIDIEKLAFAGAEFNINPELIKKAQSKYVSKKKRGMKLRMSSISYRVSYRLVENTYYLNYVRGQLKMKVRRRKKLFPVNFETSFELAVSEVDTIDVKRFKRKEAENLHSIFFDDIHEYDEGFWEHYNFIKPDVPLQEAIKKHHNLK